MNHRNLATENPKADQWKLLAQFAYPSNIRNHLSHNALPANDNSTIEFIAGCIQQSEAYFRAAEQAPLDIAPLLLYYGASNLLAGASTLVNGKLPAIENHGVLFIPPNTEPFRIADCSIKPVDPKNGALQSFCNAFSGGCLLVNGATWTLEEILGSIPDLKRDFENCYPKALTYTIPVQVVRRKAGTLERFDPAEVARYQTPQHALRGVNGLGTAYLPPQYKKYLVLYRRIDSADIGTYSILGQKSLVIAHLKNGQSVTPSQLILMHMGLFALGHISRYRPQIWNPFVRTDETGERLVIEKFLGICQRYLPNLVLNEILHEQIQFVYEVERGIDLTASLTDSDLRDMEDRIVKKLREEGGRQ